MATHMKGNMNIFYRCCSSKSKASEPLLNATGDIGHDSGQGKMRLQQHYLFHFFSASILAFHYLYDSI